MGLGGNLMWSPLAYEIYRKTNKICVFVNDKKIVEDKAKLWKNLDFILDNTKHNLTYDQIENNSKYVLIDMNIRPDLINGNPNINQHTILSRCRFFGIKNPEMKIHMKFTKKELNYVKSIYDKLPEKFILIEPHAKTSWCIHKQYPLNKWQNIVNALYPKIPIVQMSLPDNLVLENVINIGHKINSFREACLMTKFCSLLLSSEGGLMHGAKVFNKLCFMIYCPMFDPIWTKYDNVYFEWVKSDTHYNCFQQGTCQKCLNIMKNHNENIIIKKLNKIITNL